MAERVGFEPTVPYGTRALQARAFGQTTLPLHTPDQAYLSGGRYYTINSTLTH